MRRIFLFLPTHTKNIIIHTCSPSRQIRFRHYFVFQNPPCCKMRWWLCLYPPETLKQISLVRLSIFFKNIVCKFDCVHLSFQTQEPPLSSPTPFSPKICINCCSWNLSHSNKFLLHSIFQDHFEFSDLTPPCHKEDSLLEEMENNLGKLSLRVVLPTHLSSLNLISLPFPTSHVKLSSNLFFHPSRDQTSFKSRH